MSTTRPENHDADGLPIDRPIDRPTESMPPAPSNSPAADQPTIDFSPAMDPAVTSIQPGGGMVMSIELAWGYLRRWYLRRFRSEYVSRMASCRHGQPGTIPIDPVDSRDLKFYRNQDTYWWAEQDDAFRWRDSLPFVRVGLAELVVMGGGFLALAVAVILLGPPWWLCSIPLLVLVGLVAWFFRDPKRNIPSAPGTVVSPADGKLVQIESIDDPDLGPCIQFGIFLSIFNVHANRAAMAGQVVAIRYRPGKMLNALRPESAKENENLDLIMLASGSEPRYFRIRQITGQFARRIVCWARPGDILQRGEMYGMIKLGSRTELIVPVGDHLKVIAKVGDKVSAGSTVFACYREQDESKPSQQPS